MAASSLALSTCPRISPEGLELADGLPGEPGETQAVPVLVGEAGYAEGVHLVVLAPDKPERPLQGERVEGAVIHAPVLEEAAQGEAVHARVLHPDGDSPGPEAVLRGQPGQEEGEPIAVVAEMAVGRSQSLHAALDVNHRVKCLFRDVNAYKMFLFHYLCTVFMTLTTAEPSSETFIGLALPTGKGGTACILTGPLAWQGAGGLIQLTVLNGSVLRIVHLRPRG